MAGRAEDLKHVELFSSLSDRQLRRIARDFRARVFKPGTTVVREGHMSGVGFFIVTDGEASVSIDGSEVATLKRGDHFGELGLISERARTATVTAAGTLSCVELPVWHFRRFLRESPDVSWKLLQHMANLVVDAQERARGSAVGA